MFRTKTDRPTWDWLCSGWAKCSPSAKEHMEVHFQECNHALEKNYFLGKQTSF